MGGIGDALHRCEGGKDDQQAGRDAHAPQCIDRAAGSGQTGGRSFACRSALLVHEADERVCPPMKPTAVALAPVLMLGIGLAACSTPESKVRSRLIEVGVSPPMAGCLAERVVDQIGGASGRERVCQYVLI